MKRILTAPALLAAAAIALSSCQDDVSPIGGSLTQGEVSIVVDSLVTDVHGTSEWVPEFDSKTTTKLIGRINVPEYGSLDCSFVTQMMASTKMNIPDSITEEQVDSARLVFSIPRGSLTGDSLAPQQLKVYRLLRQLPDTITSRFNPDGYYDPSSPMGVKSYTVSVIAGGDSAVKKQTAVNVPVCLPKEFARELFRKYRADDPIFQWPSSFNQWFPGIYVEQNFGNGCISNIAAAQGYLYWNRIKRTPVTNDSNKVIYEDHIVRDSVCLLASQPEVISSNNISYTPSGSLRRMVAEGKTVVTSPGGYIAHIRFPVDSLIRRYQERNIEMSVVAGLSMEIPARAVSNEHGLTVAPYLLMVRSADLDSFFSENKIPDSVSSFYAAYNQEDGCYRFSSMRNYFLKVLEKVKNGEPVEDEDIEFSLVPVALVTEDVNGYNSTTTYVLRCTPFIQKPSMTELDTDRTSVTFTFSTQDID